MPAPPTFTDQAPHPGVVQSVSLFIIAISCFSGGIYVFSFVQEYTVAALAGGLVLIALSFFVPLQLIALFDRRSSMAGKASSRKALAENQL